MEVVLNGDPSTLADDPADVGYGIDPVPVRSLDGSVQRLAGTQHTTQIIVTLPSLDPEYQAMIQAVEKEIMIPEGMMLWVVLKTKPEGQPSFEKFSVAWDEEGEFGYEFGTTAEDGPLAGQFVPALFVVGKDGALFYKEIPARLPALFNTAPFITEASRAIQSYTGKGCHE